MAKDALRRWLGGETVAEALSRRLRDLDKRADARRAAGDQVGALEYYSEAIRLLHHLRRTFGDDEGLLEWLSWHLNTVGELHEELDDRVAARAPYAQGNDFGRMAMSAGDTNAWMYRNLSHGLYSVGHLDWSDAVDSAVSAYLEAVEVSRLLVDLDGTNADDSYRLAYCLEWLGKALSRKGEFGGAETALVEAVSTGKRALELSEESPRELRHLSGTLCALARVQLDRSEPAYARLSASEAVEIGRRLERLDPNDADSLGCLCEALDQAGDVAFREGRYEVAAALFAEASETAKRLVQLQGESVETLSKLGSAWYGAGNSASFRNAKQEAAAAYGTAVAVQRRIIERDKRGTDHRANLAPLLRYLGLVQLDLGDVVAARGSIEESLAICRDLIGPTPGGRPAGGLTDALLALASLQRSQGNVEAARAAYAEALGNSQAALQSDPDNAESVCAMAEALFKTAEFEVSTGDRAGATTHSRQCAEAVRRYAAMVGQAWDALDYPVDTLEWLGDAFLKSGDADGASMLRQEWLAVHRRLAEPMEASEATLQMFASALRQVVAELEAVGRTSEVVRPREELAHVEERLRQLADVAARLACLPT